MGKAYASTITGTGWMTCKVDGCESTVRSRWGTLCNKHYFRGRRTGSTKDKPRSDACLTSHGYKASNWKGHPAASAGGYLYEHRRVFHEAFGPDGHSCKWCGLPLEWGGRGAGKLHVDHMDGVKTNNTPANLVASCHRCNYKRGMFMAWLSERSDDPIIRALLAQHLG